MDMNFNLGTVQTESKSIAQIKPFTISDVILKDVKLDEFKGKKDPDAIYKVIKVRYETVDGTAYHEDSIFFPRPGDEKREVRKNAQGHEYELASAFDRTMLQLAHIGNTFASKQYEKLKGLNFKSFDELAQNFVKAVNPELGKITTKLKLSGYLNKDGRYVACLPFFAAVNSNTGDLYMNDNFLGEKVFWTENDLKGKDKYESYVPTKSPQSSTDTTTSNEVAGSSSEASTNDITDIDWSKIE